MYSGHYYGTYTSMTSSSWSLRQGDYTLTFTSEESERHNTVVRINQTLQSIASWDKSYLHCRENPSHAHFSKTRCRQPEPKYQSPRRQENSPPGVNQHPWDWVRYWSYVYQPRDKGCCLETELCSTHRPSSGCSGSGHSLQVSSPLSDIVLTPSMVLLPAVVPRSPGLNQSLAVSPAKNYWRCYTGLPTVWRDRHVRHVQGAQDAAPKISRAASQHIGTAIPFYPRCPQS